MLQAISPLASMILGFLFNYTTATNKYKNSYYLSLIMLLIGNVLYYLAATPDNKTFGLILLIAGRFFWGGGGARLMTRKYVAINIQIWA